MVRYAGYYQDTTEFGSTIDHLMFIKKDKSATMDLIDTYKRLYPEDANMSLVRIEITEEVDNNEEVVSV